MNNDLTKDPSGRRYRTRYLKMKSVLYDRVTDLPALPILFDRLRTLLDDRKEIGVLQVEVSDLDMVESLYGWQVFDEIVARVAETLRASIGEQLPARSLLALNGVAGDRFLLFVPEQHDGAEPNDEFLVGASGTICRLLERAFDHEAFAGLNPALCFRSGHARLSANPFYRFERCVYAAVDRASGEHERRERRRDRSWGEELRGIIRAGSVTTVFQPVVDLATREVLGHEALARGPRDTLFEAPRSMFALSERLGVSDELDRLCWEAAFAGAVDLPPGGKLFVNVRADSFDEEGGRRGQFLSTLSSFGVDPSAVVLEVSERDAGLSPEPFLDRLRAFQDDGFALALDDVGTGRAGLSAIASLGPDYLKIDASLVRGIDESLLQQEVLATLVELAAGIDGAVIGEGIETEAEAATLAEGGAQYGQGHFFAMPAAAGSVRLQPHPRPLRGH
jgi:EAL domain-containing protein (putative c-di-GMP-specific phosphodiesterase class I)/GGDEF domain-containing protein